MTTTFISRSAVAAILIALLGLAGVADAEPARELEWQDLVPQAQLDLGSELAKAQDALWEMPEAQREGYYDVAFELSVRQGLADDTIKRSDMTDEEREILEKKPSSSWPQAPAYWSRVERLQTQLRAKNGDVAADLNGQRVRIPGYVLPLEFDGDAVTDFLLVPYVGACVHAPAPPANQIVRVSPAESFASRGLFAPVWVEGVVTTRSQSVELSLVDGQAPVDSGYEISSATIEPYE